MKLDRKFTPLHFGTSGIRAPIVDMTDMECYINTRGFIEYLFKIKEIKTGEDIALGGDLRQSTPRILSAVYKAIIDEGCNTIYCGSVPTPAISYYAWQRNIPAIMVTGSHIPEELNGIKFIKSHEEVLKAEEKSIMDCVSDIREKVYSQDENESLFDAIGAFKQTVNLPSVSKEKEVLQEFEKRYTSVFPPNILYGKKIVLYEQSAVGRDILKNVLTDLGAEVISYGRSDKFIPIDTEKMPENVISLLKQLAKDFKPFAIVSTDGDSDRPILADENGTFLIGDLLGTLVSLYLKPEFAAMTATCDVAAIATLEKSNIKVVLTKVGSPYLIAAMNEELAKNSNAKIVSWERNGGYMLGSNFSFNDKVIGPLPTRDSILPIVVAIVFSVQENISLSALIDTKLPHRFNVSNAIDNKTKGCESYTAEMGKNIIAYFSPKDSNIKEIKFTSQDVNQEARDIKSRLQEYFSSNLGYGDISSINYLDGVRISFSNGDIVHLRPSSNAPEFRLYVTADTEERANKILADRFVIIPAIISAVK